MAIFRSLQAQNTSPDRSKQEAIVSNFLREHIVCIIIVNNMSFVNKPMDATLVHYNIKHQKPTSYYPQSHSQAEVTNKVILKILSKMVHEYKAD